MNVYSEGGAVGFLVEGDCLDGDRVPDGSTPEEAIKREILRKLRSRLQQLETPSAPDWPPLVP